MRDSNGTAVRLGRPPTISRGRIAAAAAEGARNDGLDSITVGSVANRLGVTSRALYHHIEGRDDIVAMACEHVLDPLTRTETTPLSVQHSLSELLELLRLTLLEFPGVGPYILRRGLADPVAERLIERFGLLLKKAGVAADETTARAVILLSWSISAVVREHGASTMLAARDAVAQVSGTSADVIESSIRAVLRSTALIDLERGIMLGGVVTSCEH